jgi:cobalt-zinc-cadmium efflux system outer membrane protein
MTIPRTRTRDAARASTVLFPWLLGLVLHAPAQAAESIVPAPVPLSARAPVLRLTLPEALGRAERASALLEGARARREAALAAGVTARQLPNPEVELVAGPVRPRGVGGPDGSARSLAVSQPLDYPAVREARAGVADAGVLAAQAAERVLRRALHAKVRNAFYQILQREEQLRIAEEDLANLQQIRDRVGLRVDLGESPRLDLIRADTELLNARRARDAARMRVDQARAALAVLVAAPADSPIEVAGGLPALPPVPPLPDIRESALRTNPELAQLDAERGRSRARVDLEQRLRTPAVSLRGGVDQEPDQSRWRLGVSVPLPLFNRREGQIREAAAEAAFAQAQFDARRQALLAELDQAYTGFSLARQQVQAFEGGLLRQAQQSLRVAEAAYRFGERGIIEYLDAQRTLRLVRQEYANALFEARYALIELERLIGSDLLEGRT